MVKYFQYRFWFVTSILTSILFSLAGLKLAFQDPFILQDDARQHIFWMQQFSNPDFFKNDLIADYFRSVAPTGFVGLYKLVDNLGVDIFFFNKISPLFIGLVTTIYCFKVCLEIFPIPFAGFLSTLLLNQNLWMLDDLSSGTPRAFIYPLFLAFIYYLLRNDLYLCLLAIILQGLLYPQAVLISATVLLIKLMSRAKTFILEWGLRRKETKRATNSFYDYYTWDKSNIIALLGLITSGFILAFYGMKTSNYEPIITIEQAKLMPEFAVNGRSAFFTDNFLDFWLFERRSGWLPIEWQYTLICSCGLIVLWLRRILGKFPLVSKVNDKSLVLWQIIIASTILFFLSHLLLFRLHLPSRYIHHSLRLVLAVVDAIAITIIFDKIISHLNFKYPLIQNIYKYLAIIILIFLLILPSYAVQSYPHRLGYVTGKATKLYQFLRQQPPKSLIATLSHEADNIPSFAARSVLVAEEYAIPYHQGYYQQIRQRVKELIAAQYSLDRQTIISLINKYGIDLWLLDTDAFQAQYLQNNQWLQQFTPEVTEAISVVESNQKPVLSQMHMRQNCTIFQTERHLIWKTDCLLKSLRNQLDTEYLSFFNF
ncbi:hypothetical protein Xen7305DRAFT_00045230 [Xenococcus sp. PCC 7305]|uniref:hypothetical protein n=1 Tax=Xenococcus sp. PCC 7305 TaxID=102125 RepID=UPI0002AC13F0|nr:hypothetical protein [Xenococcus sp. PCC 7305]ELS04787.1 hypothetical protein Xen7305DRAFT_00045230 [Xenococcus sp. PCC 7305]